MNEGRIFDTPANDSPGLLLWQVTMLWQKGVNKALEPHDLTHPQFVTLACLQWLLEQKEQVMQIDLSSFSKIDPMTTSTILKNLEKRGLIVRKIHLTDTRAKGVQLSDAGLELLNDALASVEQFDNEFFALLGKRQSQFNQHLSSLIKQGLRD